MNTTIKFAKIKQNAIIPQKRIEDAGLDLYACFDEIKEDYFSFAPHETRLIPTGIACACDKDYCLIVKERGSTGSKGIAVRAGVIDSGYRGEIFVALTNTTNKPMFIVSPKFGYNEFLPQNILVYDASKAIAQALVIPVPNVNIQEISYEELKNITSERRDGSLGSTNK